MLEDRVLSCTPIKFRNVPPDVFNCMKKKLQEYGIHVPPGNRGEISGKGLLQISNGMGNLHLTITITEKPFIVSCGAVAGKIKGFVKECHGS